MKTNKLEQFIKFTVHYFDCNERSRSYDFYATFYPSANLKIYNPAYPVGNTVKNGYYRVKVPCTEETDHLGAKIYDAIDIKWAFIELATKERFYGFDYWQIGDTKVDILAKLDHKYDPLDRIDVMPERTMMFVCTEDLVTVVSKRINFTCQSSEYSCFEPAFADSKCGEDGDCFIAYNAFNLARKSK